jgi:hypothetical protein
MIRLLNAILTALVFGAVFASTVWITLLTLELTIGRWRVLRVARRRAQVVPSFTRSSVAHSDSDACDALIDASRWGVRT